MKANTTPVMWRDPRFEEVFLIGAGQIVNVSPGMWRHYDAQGVPTYIEQHAGILDDVLHHTGRRITDLTRVS